jgi:hypothetical protein
MAGVRGNAVLNPHSLIHRCVDRTLGPETSHYTALCMSTTQPRTRLSTQAGLRLLTCSMSKSRNSRDTLLVFGSIASNVKRVMAMSWESSGHLRSARSSSSWPSAAGVVMKKPTLQRQRGG